MSEEFDLNVTELRQKRVGTHEPAGNGHTRWTEDNPRIANPRGRTKVIGTGSPQAEFEPRAERPVRMVDPWRLVDALTRRWGSLVIGGLAIAAVACAAAIWATHYSVVVELMRRETPNAFASGNDSFQAARFSYETLFDMMRAPEILKRVAAQAAPPMSVEEISKAVKIVRDRNPDFVLVSVAGQQSKEALVDLANLYAREVVQFTRELQSNAAGEISQFLKPNLKAVEDDLGAVNDEMVRFSRESEMLDFNTEVQALVAELGRIDFARESARIDREALNLKINWHQTELAKQAPSNDRLHAAQEELMNMRARGLTDLHPAVEQQKAKIAAIEKQASEAAPGPARGGQFGGNTLANMFYMQIIAMQSEKEALAAKLEGFDKKYGEVQARIRGLSGKVVEYALLKARQQNLEIKRNLYLDRQREAQLLEENALGYFRIFAEATLEGVNTNRRYLLIAGLTVTGALLGVLVAAALVLLTEVMDSRIKTVADLERITHLPVLATLGDLRRMTPSGQVHWAFRTLTMLQGKLSNRPDQSLVCGFISSQHGEGRSTWINLLVSAASQRGLRVLTVATRPADATDSDSGKNPTLLPVGPTTTLGKNVLAYPAQVIEQFNDPEAQPVIHIPLPGWVWNLERRKQWQSAVAHWQKIDNLVLLIELPPACEPESVLLAENLPQVIWLAESGRTRANETRTQIETLRHARCNLVGAVLNREPASFWRDRFGGWFQGLGLFLGVLWTMNFVPPGVGAAEPAESTAAPASGATNLSFSATTPVKRAAWQERLTLGPGDSLDIFLFGHPELMRTNVVIAPDGRLNYLQAQNFPAAGLTIDELRARLNEELSRYYVAARTIITPVSFNSKKYFVLGKVVNRGVFTLDRPLTILEAVARARGLETGFVERNTVEVADLSRSFLVRNGKRLTLDFERLFHQGDLTQNIPLEPDDYLFFAPADLQEIYVLGEVTVPGIAAYTADASVLAAITTRGGFTPRAYKKRVLVIRGSIERPEPFVIDTAAMLDGRAPDFKLRPKDIVYVSPRPWIKVEELLDIAAEAFVQAAITSWVGGNVRPAISSPILPRL